MKNLKHNVAEVVKFIEKAHEILKEAKGTKYQDMFIKSADSYLVHALNDLVHLEEKL